MRTTGRRRGAGWWLALASGIGALALLAGTGLAWFWPQLYTRWTGRAVVRLSVGETLGQPRFADGDTAHGGHGQEVDGIPAEPQMASGYHVHAHLSLWVNGQQVAIPAGVGIVQPGPKQAGVIGSGQAYYWLHTHDASGILHVEAPRQESFTLGQFFDIWGEPLSRTQVAQFSGPVRVYVGGRLYAGDPRSILLTAHQQIVLEVGPPWVTPPLYVFPAGL
ncbi:MAG: hypothetical protein K6T31_10345 [Alicyclobacillus sp.]|nr:hypothetical protein [Alicyclobacillus sp.]